MKQTILVLTTMALFAACGGGADTSALGKKRAERDSLKTVYAELGVKIKDIETWLAENDSTVRRNLSTVTSTPVVAGTLARRMCAGRAWARGRIDAVRGARSGRVAWQFFTDLAGRHGLAL